MRIVNGRIFHPTMKLLKDLAHSQRSSMRSVLEESLMLINPLELSDKANPTRAPWFGNLNGASTMGTTRQILVRYDAKVVAVLEAAKERRVHFAFLAHEALLRMLRNIGHQNLEQFTGEKYTVGTAYQYCSQPAKGIRKSPSGKTLHGVRMPVSADTAALMRSERSVNGKDKVIRDMIQALSKEDVVEITGPRGTSIVQLGVKAQRALKAKVLELGIPGWKVLECATRFELSKRSQED